MVADEVPELVHPFAGFLEGHALRLPCGLMSRILGHGLDTLVLNFYWPEGTYSLPEGLPEKLDALKDQYRVNPEAAILWGVDATCLSLTLLLTVLCMKRPWSGLPVIIPGS